MTKREYLERKIFLKTQAVGLIKKEIEEHKIDLDLLSKSIIDINTLKNARAHYKAGKSDNK